MSTTLHVGQLFFLSSQGSMQWLWKVCPHPSFNPSPPSSWQIRHYSTYAMSSRDSCSAVALFYCYPFWAIIAKRFWRLLFHLSQIWLDWFNKVILRVPLLNETLVRLLGLGFGLVTIGCWGWGSLFSDCTVTISYVLGSFSDVIY